jgi:hypothetical protein
MRRLSVLPYLAPLCLAALPAQAAPPAPAPQPAATEAAVPVYRGDPASEAQRARLNSLVAEKARMQIDENNQRNAAAAQAYQDALAARQAQIQHDQDAYRARQAEYEEAMARWRADVAACNAGDRKRCGPPVAGK